MNNRPPGQSDGLIEFAVILILVAVVVIIILATLGPSFGYLFNNFLHFVHLQ